MTAADPALLKRILALRPTGAAQHLGDSVLPVLDPRDLARALDDAGVPLVCVPVVTAAALPGLLRAARDQDAVLGLSAPHRPGGRDVASTFFGAVRAASAECRHRRPVFLQAGPLRLTSEEPRALRAAREDIYRYVDAGFSLLSLDASALPPEAGVRVVAELVGAAEERELSVEVAAPVDRAGRASPAALETCLEGLRARQVEIRFVRVRSAQFLPSTGGGDPGPNRSALEELSEIARAFGAWLSVEIAEGASKLSTWAPGGVRKLDVGVPFAEMVLGALGPELRRSLPGRAAAAGVPVWELLAQLGEPLAEASAAVRERVEALAYAEALDLLEASGGRGSATEAVAYLALRAGS